MAHELSRQAHRLAVHRQAVREVARLAVEARVEQATLRAISAVGEYAVGEVDHLKRMQQQMECGNPDAAEAIAFIVNATVSGIGRRVHRFASEVE